MISKTTNIPAPLVLQLTLVFRLGYSALMCLLYYTQTAEANDNPKILQLLRLFINTCGIDSYVTDRGYQWSGNSSTYEVPALFYAIRIFTSRNYSDKLPILTHLIHADADLEDPGLFGDTAILSAARSYHTQLAPVMRPLLQAGANVRAVDEDGLGVFHLLFSTLAACNVSEMREEEVEDVVDICRELLQRGADPELTNEWGLTAAECALQPVAWVVWCRALSRGNAGVAEVSSAGYGEGRRRSAPDLEGYAVLEKAYGPAIVDMDVFEKEFEYLDAVCLVCDSPASWRFQRYPFDAFSAYSFPKNEHHLLLDNHGDGTRCSNYEMPGSCSRNDEHGKNGLPYRFDDEGFDGRKWVAYKLWDEGFLNTPREAQEWAENVMTQEAFDSWGHLAYLRPSVFA